MRRMTVSVGDLYDRLGAGEDLSKVELEVALKETLGYVESLQEHIHELDQELSNLRGSVVTKSNFRNIQTDQLGRLR